jgi:pantoate--beta-alanine ligase
MHVTASIDQVRQIRGQDGNASWGLVPTMGYLHAGHLALVQRALAENDRVAVSIYVNPTQFAPTEDLSAYPRDLARDLSLLRDAGVDFVFTPDDSVMYPTGFQTTVSLAHVTQTLEGSSRPTHFAGVVTVVAKLFNIIQPTRAYFGQKDAQQAIVLQQMARDLNFNVAVVICPIVREADGLAMSSRNVYLSAEQRKAATVLNRSLRLAFAALNAGERDGTVLRSLLHDTISAESLATIDYVSVADPVTLLELDQVAHHALLSLAVFFGRTRLIDNILWQQPAS